jgi:uncharacterized integral membrane protein
LHNISTEAIVVELLLFFVFAFLFLHALAWTQLVYPVVTPGDWPLALVLAIPLVGTGLMIYGWVTRSL